MKTPSGNTFLHHTKCPKCPSSDAFALYDDGHGFCFSCKFFQPSNAVQQLEQVAKMHMEDILREGNATQNVHIESDVQNVKRGVHMPADVSKTIDVKALTWLSKYDILREEIIQHGMLWSANRHWLVFPIRGVQQDLLAFQARCFPMIGETRVEKKWLSFGEVGDTMHIMAPPKPISQKQSFKTPIVLVEDIVSAIKVSRHGLAMPLFGSHLNMARLVRLKKYFTDTIVIWLDADKYPESIAAAKRAELLGLKTHVVYTDLDPKDLSDEVIERTIRT